MDVRPTGNGIAAEVGGVDIRQPLSDDTVGAIRQAWHENLVFFVRRQPMDHEQHMAFTRNFGELELTGKKMFTAHFTEEELVAPEDTLPPYVSIISNIVVDGKAIGGLGSGEAFWHTDSSLVEQPPAGGFLRSVEVPPEGGSTHFLNMYEALETLPDSLRKRIEGRRIKHPATHTSAGEARPGYEDVTDVSAVPGTLHPIVRTHPGTGRQALYLGRRLNAWVEDMDVAESEELLDALWNHATTKASVYRHDWTVGDLVVWDNRCVMHRRDAFSPNTRRLMHRTNIKGERPY